MTRFIDAAVGRARLVLTIFAFFLLAGLSAYQSIPKEAEPDVTIPIVTVSVGQRGISPEDAERLILRPLETALKGIESLKEMRSTAVEGTAYVVLEFEAGFDASRALADVRAKVDDARRDLPADADEPQVSEVNLSLFPVLVIGISGNVPERTLNALSRQAELALEQIPGVLSAERRGVRDAVLEIIVEPMLLASYGLSLEDLARAFAAGNALVAAGSLEGETGRFSVKVPSLVETAQDILSFPIVSTGRTSVTLADVAEVRPTFKDATTITRIDGEPAVAIELVKRSGANMIETVDAVRAVMARLAADWPETVAVSFTQDRSQTIRDMLVELQNSVLTAVLVVLVVLMFVLGARSALFVGMAVPGSFLAGILILSASGLTVNIVVLFSLILAVGMLVDDAIIVSDDAERRLAEGEEPARAYADAAKRMTGPVIASTVTRIAAFSPLLFWPGIVGEFMKFMPITLIAVLTASTVIALLVIPALGASLARKRGPRRRPTVRDESIGERNPYLALVRGVVARPLLTLAATGLVLAGTIVAYRDLGRGVEFFPDVEPDYALVQVRARGNLSLSERDLIVRDVETRIRGMAEITTVYTRVGGSTFGSQETTEDTIGRVQFELVDWRERRPASAVMAEVRERLSDIPGIVVDVTKPQAGPPTGKAITLELTGLDAQDLARAASEIADVLRAHPDIRDLDDGRPLPGIDWTLRIDRAQAQHFGADAGLVGTMVQLVTGGAKVTSYRPDDTDRAVDVLVRFPPERRTLDTLDALVVATQAGNVPVSNFVEREAVQRRGTISRVDGRRAVTITANLAEGANNAAVQSDLARSISALDLPSGILVRAKGEDEERAAAGAFLTNAFLAALFLIFVALLAQFNRFSYVFVTLTAVVLSTIGVLVGLMVMGQPFGVVMTGIGVIANAGVIVNNNIVLIDTYARLRQSGRDARSAIVETCRRRVRPVLLTAVTAMLGVVAIAFGINLDFVNRTIDVGAPSTQWWISLSTAIVFGLGFATLLTLVVTPALLSLVARLERFRPIARLSLAARLRARVKARSQAPHGDPAPRT